MSEHGVFQLLEDCIKKYPAKEFLFSDPIQIPHKYSRKEDQELVGLICSLFAYGRVRSILDFLDQFLKPMGSYPCDWLRNKNAPLDLCCRKPYRFQTTSDLLSILQALVNIVNKCKYPRFEFSQARKDQLQRMKMLQSLLYENITSNSYGIKHFIGSINAGSTKKRICMFYRWMVRNEYPDFGLYRNIDTADLIIPVDVHIARIARNLGWTFRKTNDLTLSLEITHSLAKISPADPLKYDFYLTRAGILGHCKGTYLESLCEPCGFQSVCRVYREKSFCHEKSVS